MKCSRCKKNNTSSKKYCKTCLESLKFNYKLCIGLGIFPWIIIVVFGLLRKDDLFSIGVIILYIAMLYWPCVIISIILIIMGIVGLIKLN